jgi:hypothetical protein
MTHCAVVKPVMDKYGTLEDLGGWVKATVVRKSAIDSPNALQYIGMDF